MPGGTIIGGWPKPEQKVIWVQGKKMLEGKSSIEIPGIVIDTPYDLDKYLKDGYLIKDFNVFQYKADEPPLYMFILEQRKKEL